MIAKIPEPNPIDSHDDARNCSWVRDVIKPTVKDVHPLSRQVV
jgi:hypothetical protein